MGQWPVPLHETNMFGAIASVIGTTQVFWFCGSCTERPIRVEKGPGTNPMNDLQASVYKDFANIHKFL